MSLKFELGSAAGGAVRKATEHVLKISGLAATAVEGNKFAVTNAQGTFVGVRAMLRVAGENGAPAGLLGTTTTEKIMIDQWVATAMQVNSNAVPLIEVEPMVPTKGFLSGGTEATAGDLFLYCVAAETVLGNGKQYPNLFAWSKGAEKSDLIAPVKVAAAAPTTTGADPTTADSTAGGDAKKGKGAPKEKAARPSEEQLAALRAEKEAAKAAKAAEKEANGGAAPSADSPAAVAGDKKDKKKKEWGEKGANKEKKTLSVDPADLDLRIGKVLTVEKHPDSDKLYVEKIELGDKEGPRTIVSGLVAHYKAEEIQGANVLVLCNMKPRSLAGVPSAGMVLCASDAAGKLALVTCPDAAPGTRVVVGTSVIPENHPAIPSVKQMEELIKHFNSDAEGQVKWQEKALLVSGTTAIQAKIPNAIVK